MGNKNTKTNEDKVMKILEIVSNENLDDSSNILARAMVLNYDRHVNSQEHAKAPASAGASNSGAILRR